jgi:hypothetical protein
MQNNNMGQMNNFMMPLPPINMGGGQQFEGGEEEDEP